MKPTVETGQWVAGRESSEGELMRQLAQVRLALNKVYQKHYQVDSTGSGTNETLFEDSDDLEADSHASLTVIAVGSNASGSSYGKFEHTALFFRPASGSASQLGSTQVRHPDITAGGVALTLGLDGNKLLVQGNDGGVVLTWDLWLEVRKG